MREIKMWHRLSDYKRNMSETIQLTLSEVWLNWFEKIFLESNFPASRIIFYIVCESRFTKLLQIPGFMICFSWINSKDIILSYVSILLEVMILITLKPCVSFVSDKDCVLSCRIFKSTSGQQTNFYSITKTNCTFFKWLIIKL